MILDLILHNGYVITMEGNGCGVINDGAVGIRGNKIEAVGASRDILTTYNAHRYIDAHNKVIMPGFVDCHIHTSDTIVRGGCQDIDNWMEDGIWPLLSRADEEALAAGSMVNIIEAVKNGTTTLCDYESPMLALIPNHIAVGNRLVAANMINEIPDNEKQTPGELYRFDPAVGQRKLMDNLKMIEDYHGLTDNKIICMLGPQALDMCSEELLSEIRALSEKYDVGIHMHLEQGQRETNQMEKRYHMRSVEFAKKLNLLNERLLAVHLTSATGAEVKEVAQSGAGMVLCTASIGILGGKLPPAEEFKKYSDRVGLGSDQSPGNNCNNMFNEMKFTSIAHKYKHKNGTSYPAWKVLRMATIEGAGTLGLGDMIGSLKVGKRADIIMIDLLVPNLSPIMDWPIRNIIPNLVYAARGNEVEMVIVDGKIIVENHILLTVNEKEAINKINICVREICRQLSEDESSQHLPLVQWTKDGRQ